MKYTLMLLAAILVVSCLAAVVLFAPILETRAWTAYESERATSEAITGLLAELRAQRELLADLMRDGDRPNAWPWLTLIAAIIAIAAVVVMRRRPRMVILLPPMHGGPWLPDVTRDIVPWGTDVRIVDLMEVDNPD